MSLYAPTQKFTAAFDWLSRGAQLVPVQRDSKFIVKGFGPRQQKIDDAPSAALWFGERACNVGVVTGGVIGLACLDFDTPAAYAAWRNGPGLEVQTVIEKTRRGYHVWFSGAHDVKACAGEGWELKAAGAVCMVAPSSVAGVVYQCLTDYPLADISAAAFALLSEKQSSKRAPVVVSAPKAPQAQSNIVEKIKASVSVLALAEGLAGPLNGDGRYKRGRCPFHDDTAPSFWVDVELNLWGCFAASCPQHGAHDVINLAALINKLDTREAIKLLAREVAR